MNDLAEIKKLLEAHQRERVEAHESFSKSLSEIQTKLDPVYEVYSQFKGFGNIAMGFFKFVVIPISIVMGIILTIKNLLK